jgi:hypothetical protein
MKLSDDVLDGDGWDRLIVRRRSGASAQPTIRRQLGRCHDAHDRHRRQPGSVRLATNTRMPHSAVHAPSRPAVISSSVETRCFTCVSPSTSSIPGRCTGTATFETRRARQRASLPGRRWLVMAFAFLASTVTDARSGCIGRTIYPERTCRVSPRRSARDTDRLGM